MKKKNKFYALLTLIAWQIVCANNFAFAQTVNIPFNQKNQAFQFEQFPAKVIDYDPHKKPVFSSNLTMRYKTIVTQAMSQPANFAGHYRVVKWGCGTDCRGFAIINKMTGATYTLPGVEFVSGVMGNDEERLDFRKDSRLFIITGTQNEKAEGRFYYLWSQEKLQLLAKHPIMKKAYSE